MFSPPIYVSLDYRPIHQSDIGVLSDIRPISDTNIGSRQPDSTGSCVCRIMNSTVCSQCDACTWFGPSSHRRLHERVLISTCPQGCDASLTVSTAAVGVVRDSGRHRRHQRVLDGHLPHAGHILSDPADLRRHSRRRTIITSSRRNTRVRDDWLFAPS